MLAERDGDIEVRLTMGLVGLRYIRLEVKRPFLLRGLRCGVTFLQTEILGRRADNIPNRYMAEIRLGHLRSFLLRAL
jgi:hypothetical protein